MTHPPQGSDETAPDDAGPSHVESSHVESSHVEPEHAAEPDPPAQTPPSPPPGYGQTDPYDANPPYGATPPYGAPQQAYGEPPQSGAPQYGAPQYGAPQYGAPQYGAPQYGPPQYGAPQYGPPQYGAGEFPPPPAEPKSKVGLIALLTGVALLVIAGVVVLVISLQTTVLDASSAERDVAAQFEQREGVAIDLHCPNDMKVTTGATYTCTGKTADGESVTVKLTITDEKTAAYTWTVP